MKILLLEYITGGGLAGLELPASLVREGRVMAAALAEDLLAVPAVELVIPWDARLPAPAYAAEPRVTLLPVADAEAFAQCWSAGLADCDAAWPLAPETAGVLEGLCRQVEQAGTRLLTSPAAAVALAASKRATGERLAACGIATLPSYPLHGQPADLGWPRVVKPDDGVGCEGIRRVDDLQTWAQYYADQSADNLLVQPYVAGPALSLSALFGQGEALLLTVNRQLVEEMAEGAFRLQGCEVNGLADEAGSYAALAQRIAQAVPELEGYVGVDFIQSEDGPVVLEINPRLTSSYAGLKRALGINPAALVLDWFASGVMPCGFSAPRRAVSVYW